MREFVLAWRARDAEPDEAPEEPTLAELMEDWLCRDALPNQRRQARHGTPAPRQPCTRDHKRRRAPAATRSRVGNAFDYELVRAELLARTDQRTWEPHRDAAMLDLQFGSGCRPQEARGARWWQVLWPTDNSPGVLRVREVVAAGQIDGARPSARCAMRSCPA